MKKEMEGALGNSRGNFYHDYEVNRVIVDENIMVHQPPRYTRRQVCLILWLRLSEICNGRPEIRKKP